MTGLIAAGLSARVATAQTGPALTIDGAASRHAISPYIYGMAEYGVDPAFQAEVSLPVMRWGGDGTTRYNWMVDSSNAGLDFYFIGGNGETNPTPSYGPDELVKLGRTTGTQTLLTIPIIPWINADSLTTCSFPDTIYGPQQAQWPFNPGSFLSHCGNSIAGPNNVNGPNGTQLIDHTITANHIPNTAAIQQAWVRHLVGRFGKASAGGVKFYQIDNEPYGWANTHRDVQPQQPTYDTIESLTETYAAAVKAADPSALVMGPSDFGWPAYVGNGTDLANHKNVWNAPWYLGKLAAYKAAHGVQLLDYFDEHYYPIIGGDTATILASTRSLWDPTYVENDYIGQYYGAIMLIPRMKAWVAQNDPGIKVAVSEYSWGSTGQLVDALAEADVLGIFGREGLDFASMWNVPKPTDPLAFAFRVFRDYDGHHRVFGDLSVQAASADQGSVAVYAALRKDERLTAVLINKTTGPLTSQLFVGNLSPSGNGQSYVYDAADLNAIRTGPVVAFSGGRASVTLPALSITVLVVPLSGAPYTTP